MSLIARTASAWRPARQPLRRAILLWMRLWIPAALALPAAAPAAFLDEAQAPRIQAELLALGQVGDANDQWLVGATLASDRVVFQSEKGLKVTLTLDAQGHVSSVVPAGPTGSRQAPDYSSRLKYSNGGTLAPGITYGYRQVNAIQQQPFLAGKGWTLWGFTFDQAKSLNLMADSRIRYACRMPNGNLMAFGWCDGGNTSLHRDPRDITKASPFMGYQFGGGKGSSTLLTEVTPAGVPLHQAFLGTAVGDVAWDRWGRLYAVGSNMSEGTYGPFARRSSGSLLILSRDLKSARLDIRLGGSGTSYKDNAWVAVDLDESSGLLALSGWTAQAVEQPLNSVQEANGGGKDGLYALIRLWPAGSVPAGRLPASPAPGAGSKPAAAPNPFRSHIPL